MLLTKSDVARISNGVLNDLNLFALLSAFTTAVPAYDLI